MQATGQRMAAQSGTYVTMNGHAKTSTRSNPTQSAVATSIIRADVELRNNPQLAHL